jgi:hypothetical protein
MFSIYCQELAPEYIKAAEILAESGLRIAAIDCITNEVTQSLFWVT